MTRLLVGYYCDTVVMLLVVGLHFLCVVCTEIGKRLQSAVEISDMDMGEVCGRASVRERMEGYWVGVFLVGLTRGMIMLGEEVGVCKQTEME